MIDLDQIDFQKFSEPQIKMFHELIDLYNQDLQTLDPSTYTTLDNYQRDWHGVKSVVVFIDWLIRATDAIAQAEVAEKEGQGYFPEDQLQTLQGKEDLPVFEQDSYF